MSFFVLFVYLFGYNNLMQIHTLRDNIKIYLNSLYFPLTIGVLAFFTWLMPGMWAWLFVSFYMILVFAPLFADDGRAYLPLIFYNLIIVSENIHFIGGIPVYLIISLIFYGISMVLYVIIHKPKMITGAIFFALLVLYLVFLVSYLISVVINGVAERTGILYLMAFFLILSSYTMMNSVLGKEETMPYYAQTVVIFATAAALEVTIKLISTTGFAFADDNFTIGWSYTRETVSTFLILSLPFFSILLNNKKLYWIFPELFVLFNTIMLSTDSGLLAILFFSVPMVILTLKDFGRVAPYYTLAVLLILGMTFGILMGVNANFNLRIVTAILRLNLFTEESLRNFQEPINYFTSNPVIGSSIATFVNKNGTITLTSNTILSTLQLGGILGASGYAIFEVAQYVTLIKKKASEKGFILLFLLSIEVIGLISNTIYNVAILTFLLMTLSVYQQSNRPDEVRIHDSYFVNYNEEQKYMRIH